MATIDNYRNMLPTNKHRLDDELEVQASIQYDIGAEVARLNTRALEAENKLKSVEAELYVQFKDEGGKMTADEIKAAVRINRNRVSAWNAYMQIRETHEQWQALLAAWIVKGYKLADLGNLFGADYFAMNTVRGDRRQDVVDIDARAAVRAATEEVARKKQVHADIADQRPDWVDDAAPRRRKAL